MCIRGLICERRAQSRPRCVRLQRCGRVHISPVHCTFFGWYIKCIKIEVARFSSDFFDLINHLPDRELAQEKTLPARDLVKTKLLLSDT